MGAGFMRMTPFVVFVKEATAEREVAGRDAPCDSFGSLVSPKARLWSLLSSPGPGPRGPGGEVARKIDYDYDYGNDSERGRKTEANRLVQPTSYLGG